MFHNIEHPEDLPELGTAHAAVESCVSLIAGMVGQPEQIIHYWCDLYFQVRLMYEREKAQEEEARTVRLTPEVKQIIDDYAERSRAEEPVATAATPAPEPAAAEAQQAPGPEAAPAPAELPRDNRSGNAYAAEAARFKRETRERLIRLRANGLTTAKIVELANGAITNDTVHLILDAMSVPVAVYRLLAAVLDKYEDMQH